MLTMQVPAGKPLAGMVHHKVHDSQWTGLPLDPAADDKVRELHRPSTAATLNLAAVAAQGARIFERYDRSFSKELLKAARRGLDRGEGQSGALRPGRRRQLRWWSVRRLGRDRRVLLGRGRAVPDDGRAPVQAGGPGLAAPRAGQFPVDGFDWRTMAPLAQLDLATLDHRLPGHWQDPAVGARRRRRDPRPPATSSRGASRTPRPPINGRGARRPRSSTTWSCWRRRTTSAATTATEMPCWRAWTSSSAATR